MIACSAAPSSFVAIAVTDQKAEVAAAVVGLVVRQVGRSVALAPALEFRVITVLIEDPRLPWEPLPCTRLWSASKSVVAAEDAQCATEQSQPMPLPMMLPSKVLWPFVEAEAQGVVTPQPTPNRWKSVSSALAAVEILAGDQPLAVAAEVAGEAQSTPIAAAVEIVELVDVVPAAVEQHADAAAGRPGGCRRRRPGRSFIAGRFGLVRVDVQPAQVIVVMAADVVDDAESERAAESLCPHAGMVVVAAAVADDDARPPMAWAARRCRPR